MIMNFFVTLWTYSRYSMCSLVKILSIISFVFFSSKYDWYKRITYEYVHLLGIFKKKYNNIFKRALFCFLVKRFQICEWHRNKCRTYVNIGIMYTVALLESIDKIVSVKELQDLIYGNGLSLFDRFFCWDEHNLASSISTH